MLQPFYVQPYSRNGRIFSTPGSEKNYGMTTLVPMVNNYSLSKKGSLVSENDLFKARELSD